MAETDVCILFDTETARRRTDRDNGLVTVPNHPETDKAALSNLTIMR
jgi:hypothetical protein